MSIKLEVEIKIHKLFKSFFDSEKSSGILLILATVLSLILANSEFSKSYIDFWNFPLGSHTLVQWINDGLMAIFFLLIGLELEREIYLGELSSLRSASLPIFAAVGGIVIPAAIFLWINFGTDTIDGIGIPMATDIAFAIGILALLGNRVPLSLKIFLTAMAVMDDLGAILIIAIFYTKSINYLYLLLALGIFLLLLIAKKKQVYNLWLYIIGGIIMWILMLNSGVHATITGVLLAFAIPFKKEDEKSPSYVMQSFLHTPVAFIILPIFALANTCIFISSNWTNDLSTSLSFGIIAGLLIGKPFGIWLFSYLGVGLSLCSLPKDLNWKHIIGAGFLGGIGFTMSIFITVLAFNNLEYINQSKIAIIVGSILSGLIGLFILRMTLPKKLID